MNNRSLIITGAAGFLGGYTSTMFSAFGWKTVGIDKQGFIETTKHPAMPKFCRYYEIDLMDHKRIMDILGKDAPDTIVHFAGPANVGSSFRDPLMDFEMQTLPLLHLLEAIRISGVTCRVLLISSAAVYGNPVSLPINEDHRIMPISPYGYHKYHQELLLDEYYALYGVKACKARIFSTYGPGMKQLAVWDIAKRAIAGDYALIGTGKETRDYLYIEDIASALYSICENASFTGEAYNVASGMELSIIDLASKIYAALGVIEKPRVTGHIQEGNPTRWCADISRLKGLGFRQLKSFDEGLRHTVQWIRKNV